MTVSAPKPTTRSRRAGIFDIPRVIGALLAVNGLIILLVGLFGDAEEDNSGGANANLWAGLVLLAAAAILLAWAWWRPVDVPHDVEPDQDEEARPAGR